MTETAEATRLREARGTGTPWRRWGPYLSERQWGTVREDYSENGDAWSYFTHDQARSRAYRWGEDGIAGVSDDHGLLCFAVALWNERDPILKERLFGVTNAEGNHGEDVKEYYFYLDNTPTHSYMKELYKYPQAAYPYDDLVRTNRGRSRSELEYELLDTGVFDGDRYFDVFVEYAKASPEDLLVRITAWNRGPDAAPLHLLPTLWFRNTWSWRDGAPKPALRALIAPSGQTIGVVGAAHPQLGERFLYAEGVGGEAPPSLLFSENETNNERVFGTPNASPYVKDAFHEYVVGGRMEAVNPAGVGTRVAVHHRLVVPPGGSTSVHLRLTDRPPSSTDGSLFEPFADFDHVVETRIREADEFYASLTPPGATPDEAAVLRQALAGLLWTKQHYHFDLEAWLDEHGANPLVAGRRAGVRNQDWVHMHNDDVISMPDKWEYPWYAAWDLAFHAIAFNLVDPDFARAQLDLMLRDLYLHPNGQIPAYEWNFGDVNPPVHAWATIFNHRAGRVGGASTSAEVDFLKSAFPRLLQNFTWWVNRKDPAGHNVFQGGFLGLDNIGVFDRSAPLPTGGYLEQADGTAWMALYCVNMLEIALELSTHDPSYEEMALKFAQHFLWIGAAMDRTGDNRDELWDEEDGFFYDLLHRPDGSAERIRVRSMVGLLPLTAVGVVPGEVLERFPRVAERMRSFLERHPELTANIASPSVRGVRDRRLLAVLSEDKLRRVLARMLDEDRFLGPHGVRSLSRWHLDHPFEFEVHGQEYRVTYLPAESDNAMFGGNSNWRGPVWFPVNALIIRGLLQSYLYYGDSFRIECPTGSGREMNLFEVAREIANRLIATFLRDERGHRPVYGGSARFQSDPHWRDLILFYEYFHGDNGAGIGASHQTGWTAIVAVLIELFGRLTAEEFLEEGMGVVRWAFAPQGGETAGRV